VWRLRLHGALHSCPTRRSSDLLAEGEEVKAARARRDLAEGQVIQARSGALPQVSAQLGYTRTIRSLFDDLRMIPSGGDGEDGSEDRKSTRLNSSHVKISYAVFC